jgi:hypothetical protein
MANSFGCGEANQCLRPLCHHLHPVREVASGRRRWEGLAIGSVQSNGLLDDLAQLRKYFLLLRTVAPPKIKPGALPT